MRNLPLMSHGTTMAKGWKKMSTDLVTEEDKRIWEQLVEAHTHFGRAGQAFLAPGVGRVALIRSALSRGVDPTATRMLDSLPIDELQDLFPLLLHYASFSHGAVASFRRAILSLPRDWVVEYIQVEAPSLLASGGYDEYRRILELCVELDSSLTHRLAELASAHNDPDIREAGNDFLSRLISDR
jgi:hypothetical protein